MKRLLFSWFGVMLVVAAMSCASQEVYGYTWGEYRECVWNCRDRYEWYDPARQCCYIECWNEFMNERTPPLPWPFDVMSVGHFEDDFTDGWDNAPTWYPPIPNHDTIILTPGATVGVTDGTGSLEISGIPLGDASYLGTRGFDTDGTTPLYNYDPAYPNCWWFLRGDHSASCALSMVKSPGVFGRAVFEFDVANVPEGATLRGFIHYGGAGVGYAKSDFIGVLPDEDGHVVLDYVQYPTELWTDFCSWTWDMCKLCDVVDCTTWAPSWYQVVIALDSPGLGENGIPTATLYIDNVRFVPSGPPCTVPDVVDQTQDAACTAIENANLAYGNITTACSATIAAGNVISTTPAGGASVTCGSAVDIVVSTGPCPCTCTVPDVVGKTEAQAITDIEAVASLDAQYDATLDACSCTIDVGKVVATNPGKDATVACDSTVKYGLSLGTWPVPNVYDKTLDEANQAIIDAHYVVGTRAYNWHATVVSGKVCAQNPAAGVQNPCGSAVNYTISRGPQPVNCMPPAGTGYDSQRTQFNTYVTNKWDPTQWCAYNPTTNPKGGYQCHGDADGAKSTPDNYRIFTFDLNLISANWKKKMLAYPAGADPRADIDHTASTPDNYRVFTLDLARVTAGATGNWKRKDTPCTACVPPTVCGLPKNCPLTDVANNSYVRPTSCP